jgi:F-box-like
VLERVSIGSLPDDVLLEIFYQASNHDEWQSNWPNLVHVCRRWRFVIFESPLRLKLEIICKSTTPVRKLLDIWPKFPLQVTRYGSWSFGEIDNLVAALEHRDRVQTVEIYIDINDSPAFVDSLWKQTAMQEPFPELIELSLESFLGASVLPLPNTFLNGSASRLQRLRLQAISFPSLPRLLLSTRDLTFLHLYDIPNSGYIPPETMATSLSVLPRLESLYIEFESPTPDPKRRNRPVPPQTRSVLPALTVLRFQGISEYLEVLAARIDAPLLRSDRIRIIFFNQLVFDIPQTSRFFGHLDPFRTSSLTLRTNAHPLKGSSSLDAVFFPSDLPPDEGVSGSCSWHIVCNTLDWQVYSMAQICGQILSFRSSVESLVIECGYSDEEPEIDIDPTVWLQLFHSFPSVQSLQISAVLELSIAAALEGLTGESAAEVFPSLHSLSIVVGRHHPKPAEAAPQLESMQSFVAARQHRGRPVALSRPSE